MRFWRGMSLWSLAAIATLAVALVIPRTEDGVPLRYIHPTCDNPQGRVNWEASRGEHHEWVRTGPYTYKVVVDEGWELYGLTHREVYWKPHRPLGCDLDG